MQADHRVLLAGRDIDALGIMDRSASAASKINANRDQNALRTLFAEQGPGIMSGDRNALAAYARLNPEAALGVQNQRQVMDARELSMRVQQQAMEIAQSEYGMRVAEFAQKADAAERAEASQVYAMTMQEAAQAYLAGDLDGVNEIFQRAGVGPVDSLDAALPRLAEVEAARGVIEWVNKQSAGPEQTEADREIARLTGLGIPYDVAVKIKEGVFRTMTDPVTRETIIVDLSNGQPVYTVSPDGQSNPGQTPPQQVQPSQEAPTQTPTRPQLDFGPAYQGAPDAFGLEGALRGAVNTATDAIGLGPAFPETLQAQRDFAVLKEQLINDIASGYDRQPPSWLLQNIEQLVPTAGRPFQGPEDAQSRLRAIGRDIQGQIQSAETALERQRLSPTERQTLQNRITQLRIAEGRISDALSAFAPSVELSDEDRALIDKYR